MLKMAEPIIHHRHPEFGEIGELRVAMAERGYVTLSVQMPVLAATAGREDYVALFEIAGDRIEAALRWLRAQQVEPIAIVAHSMGAGMADAYLARPSRAAVRAFVPMGMFGTFAGGARPPTLDLVAQNDFPEILAQVPVRARQLAGDRCSSMATLANTDHYLGGVTADLATRITPFLVRAFSGDCAR